MYAVVLVFHIIAAFVLIFVILLQAGRGGGLSESFGGGVAKDVLGTGAETFLTKATSVCAILFLITSLSLTILSSKRKVSVMEGVSSRKAPIKAETVEVEEPKERGETEEAQQEEPKPEESAESDAPEADKAE